MDLMKEQLQLFWRQGARERACKFLKLWCFDALMSGITQLISFPITILRRQSGLLNYYPHSITNGPLEGFKLRLYGLHTSKYALTG